eukprot:Skav212639  [mRNA]  locus=scaffold681:26483:28263:+ [translate_table: standard]
MGTTTRMSDLDKKMATQNNLRIGGERLEAREEVPGRRQLELVNSLGLEIPSAIVRLERRFEAEGFVQARRGAAP